LSGGNPVLFPYKVLFLQNTYRRKQSKQLHNDNVKRAIQRGTGEIEGLQYEELSYEGYGQNGVAIMVDVMTDNRNRTLTDVRTIFTKNGGNLGSAGCVNWIFSKKGVINFEKGSVNEEKLTTAAIDAGAEDISVEDSTIEIVTTPENFETIRDKIKAAGFEPASAEVSMIPQNTVKLIGDDAKKILKLVAALEDNDDVQAVHANFDIPDDVIAEFTGS